MKRISKLLAVGLSVLTVLSCSTAYVSAAVPCYDCQVKVIGCPGSSCSGSGCDDAQAVLQKLGIDKNCGFNTVIKNLNGYCPDGNCVTWSPSSELPTQPPETVNQPSEVPSQPTQTPTQPATVTDSAPKTDSSEFNTAYENEVITLVNAQRAKYGLPALAKDDGAVNVAHVRAKEIVKSFSHTRPDGRTCFTAASDMGVKYRTAGENIAYGYSTPQQVVNGWMNSEGHRKNILSASFSKIGVGCYSNGGVLYWSQFFIG